MRILFCSRRFFPAISGMSVYALNLLRQLVAAGHEVTMVSQYRGDAAGTRIYGGGPPPPVPGVRVIGRRSLGEEAQPADFARDVEDMAQAMIAAHREAPFDLIHAQYGYPNGWAALLAARETGLPVVVSIQGGDGHWVGSCCATHRAAMERVLRGADAVLIGCESFAAEVVERLGVPRALFTIVPGAVDVARFRPHGEPGAAADPVRLLYHGRVDRRKGALDFLEALHLLRGRGLRFQGIISGIGPDLEAARDLARARELPVRFTGYADYDAAPSVYAMGDVFVSPTHAEGFSNTILEAMACGLPVVSCRAVGVMDCLRHGENGLMTEPGDVPALAGSLASLIADGAARRRLAGAALAECRATYSWEAVAGLIQDSYRRVLAAPRRPPVDPALPTDASCRFLHAPHLL